MIIIIAAGSKNGVIGKNGTLPWNIPEDMTNFRNLTLHNTVVMGRKTFESIGHPLPDRYNIVISNTINISTDECISVRSFKEAVNRSITKDIYIIGGHSIYKQALEYADRLLITEIFEEYDGDTFFPQFEKNKYVKTIISEFNLFRFVRYDRIR